MTTPAQLLDAAEQEFRQRRFTAGAELVWDAAYQSVAAAAVRNNLPCRNEQDAYAVAAMLDSKPTEQPVDHWLQLRTANLYRTQAAHHGEETDWQWDPDEYVENLAGIREMVTCLSSDGTVTKSQPRP